METETIKSKKSSPRKHFSQAFKKKVVAEFERGFLNKDQLQAKYGLRGNSAVLKWCQKYGKLHYAQKGELGRPMKDPQKQRIKDLEKQLATVTGKKVRATYSEDAELLGGAIVRVGSTIYDGSVRGQLEKIKQQIATA